MHISKDMINFATKIGGGHVPLIRGFSNFPLLCSQSWLIKKFGIMGKYLTKEIFVSRAKHIHGDKYDYSKVNYVDLKTKVCIICPIHGEFWQEPRKHLSGCGCVKCGLGVYTTDSFISKCKELYGNNYNFSNVLYVNSRTPIKFICNRCETVLYKTTNAILSGNGLCKFCDGSGQVRNTKQFILRAKEIHGDGFDYSNVVYVNSHSAVEIICKKHGTFKQSPNSHLRGAGCPKCYGQYISTKEYIEKAKKVHGDVYDYSLIEYHGSSSMLKIICPTHGMFVQQAHNHLQGQGCPSCKSSHGENKILLFLRSKNVLFNKEYKIPNDNLFCNRINIFVDFYLPKNNSIIEFHGKQHYEPIKWFGGEKKFKEQQERDMALRQYCKEHEIKLIEIPYWDYNNIETILNKYLRQ